MSADDDRVLPSAEASSPGEESAPEPTTAPPPRDTEVTAQIPVIQTSEPPIPMEPQSDSTSGAPFGQWPNSPAGWPQMPLPSVPWSQQADPRTQGHAVWPGWRQGSSAVPNPAAGADPRAIDTLAHVGVRSVAKVPPQRGWRHVLYRLLRVNLGPSPDELYEADLHARIRRNVRDSHQIGVLGLKGGVGKTAVTMALGSSLSKIRGDRILAVDADPDAGNLADRAGRQSSATVADLLSDEHLTRYNDIRAYTSMNGANLEVLSSEEYSGANREFTDEDWKGAVDIVSRYYNLVLADCGSGMFHPAARGVLSTVSGLVVVASASVDGARQAAVTMDWLRQNGHQHLLGRTCVVINHVVPGKPNVDVEDLVHQFERHLSPGRVIVLPWDEHIAAGTEIQLDLLSPAFRRRTAELAAALSEDFGGIDGR